MRKITLIFSLLLFSVIAMAQSADKTYQVIAEAHQYHPGVQWAVNGDGSKVSTSVDEPSATVDDKKFAFVNYEGSTYIYSVSAKKFAKKDMSLTAGADADPVQVEALSSGKYFFKFDDSHIINLGGSGQMAVDGWSTKDGGNQYTLLEADDFNADEALAILDQSRDITYVFEYDGKEIASTTVVATVNSAYPAFNASVLPLGVTATVPEGTVTADETKTLVCTIDNSLLPFMYADSYENVEHWYYMTISAAKNPLYYDATKSYLDATKTEKDENNLDAYTWAFVGNPITGFKVVNRAAGASMILSSARVPEGDKEYPVMTSVNDVTGNTYWNITSSNVADVTDASLKSGFFMAYEGTGYRLNKQETVYGNGDHRVCYWLGGADNGSTFLLEERVIETLPEAPVYTASVTMNPATLPMTDVAAWSTVENNVATFTAQVYNDKYEFVGWTNGTETVSTDLVYTVTLTKNLELVANFQEKATEPEAPAYDWAGEYTVNATVTDATDNWTTPSPLTMKIFYDEAAAAYKLESFAGADIKAASGTYGYYPTVSVSADNSRVATININSGIYLASEAVMGEEIWSKSTLLRAKDGSKTVTLTVDENGVMSIPDMEIVYDVLMSDFSTHQITVLSTLIGVTATKPASIASTEALEALKASIDEAVGLLATVEFTLNDVETAIDLASNADKMLYSNAPCTDTSWGDEFKSWAVLFDDKTETIFHSEYKSGATSLDGNEHYIRVDLGDDALSRFSFTITTRSKNCEVNSPTEMVVEGCNEENGEYTEIATVNDIPQQNSYKYVSNVFTTAEAYRYIRFRVTKTGSMQKDAGGKVFFFISEFGLNKVAPVPSVAEAYTSIINDVTALNTAKAAAETLHSAESPLAAEVEAASVALSSAIETVKNALPGEPETPAEAVVLDFTTNVWAIPGQYGENYTTKYNTEASYTDGTYTVTLAPGTANKANYFYPESNDQIKNALCLKNTGSKIVLPAFDFAVAKIEVVGHESATSYANADMNVFVGGNAVSTACKGSTGTNVFAIAADAQAAGSVYELVVGEAGGAYSSIRYITKINIYPASEGGVEPIELAAPVLGDENTKKYFDLYARIPVKATFPENATETAIYYTTNGDEPTKDSHKVNSGSSVSISSYVGTTIKAVAYCVVDGKEYFSEVATATYYEAVTALYEMAGAVEAGKQYLFVANMGTAYSAMIPAEVTPTKTIAGAEVKVNDMFAEALNFFAFTLEAEATSASYKIKDATGMYLGIDGMSASFIVSETGQNVATAMVSYDWTVSFDDSGFATIQNSGRTLALVGTSWKTVTNVTATDVLPQLFVAREYPTLVVTPDNKENQEQLTEFVISCETGLGIDEEAGEIVVRDQGAYEQVVVNPGTDDEYTEYQMVYKYFEFTAKMNDEGTAYTITLNEPITESGSYELVVPEGFFIVEPTGYAQPSEAINNYYTVVSNEPLVVENVTPTDGSTVASLKYLVVDFSENVYDVYIWNFDVKDEGGNVVTTATPGLQDENGGWFSDFSWVSLSLEQEITEAGTYTITIPAGAIGAEADPSKMNSEIVLTFTVDPATGINGVDAENGEAVIYDITGRKIEQITAPGIYIVNGKKVLVK